MALQLVKLLDPLNPTIITGGLVPRGAYNAGTDYAVGDSVDYLGSSYVMYVDAGAGTLPTDTTKWQVLANKGAAGAAGASGGTLPADTDGTLAANSDSFIATQKATKTYADAKVSDTAYAGSWDGVTTIAPSKNAVYDQMQLKLTATDYDDATAAETTTGTSTAKYVSPDGLAGSDFGVRNVCILVSDPLGSAITTGNGKACVRIPVTMNGYNLVGVAASLSTVSSSGAPNVMIRRSRRTNATTRADADMLSTAITIDVSEFDTVDAATPAVIDAANDDVNTGDVVYIDIDGAGTGAKGLAVELRFQLP